MSWTYPVKKITITLKLIDGSSIEKVFTDKQNQYTTKNKFDQVLSAITVDIGYRSLGSISYIAQGTIESLILEIASKGIWIYESVNSRFFLCASQIAEIRYTV
jgi:hypothetical protein